MFFKKRIRKLPLPPGPSYGDVLDDSFMTALADIFLVLPQRYFKKYGTIYRMPHLLRHTIDVIDPIAIKQIFLTHVENYDKSNVFWQRLKLLTGNGLLTLPQSTWRVHQELIQKGFQKKYLANYAEIILQQMCEFKSGLKKSLSKQNRFDLFESMTILTLKTIAQGLSGLRLSNKQALSLHQFVQLGNYRVSNACLAHPFSPTIGNLWFQYQKNKLDRFLKSTMERRKTQNSTFESSQDMLQILLNSTLDEKSQLDEFKTLLLTGHETLAVHLTWTILLLIQHPNVLNTLRHELKQVLGNKPLAFCDLPNLPYSKAIVQESMRYYPPLWCIFRTAKEEDTLQGFRIPKKSILRVHTYALHRNPQIWENPDDFQPERFLLNSPEKYHYIPFGAGPRTCIGSNLAIMESQLILGTLFQTFDFTLLNKRKICEKPLITLQPNQRIFCQAHLKASHV